MSTRLHFPAVMTIKHKRKQLTYMVYARPDAHARFIAFYHKYCGGDGGEYRIEISANEHAPVRTYTIRMPEHISGARPLIPSDFFDILAAQDAPPVEHAPQPQPQVEWEDLL